MLKIVNGIAWYCTHLHALGLTINAIIVWNLAYMECAIQHLCHVG
jgi:hypothetical protein